jgi:hypothetical protein
MEMELLQKTTSSNKIKQAVQSSDTPSKHQFVDNFASTTMHQKPTQYQQRAFQWMQRDTRGTMESHSTRYLGFRLNWWTTILRESATWWINYRRPSNDCSTRWKDWQRKTLSRNAWCCNNHFDYWVMAEPTSTPGEHHMGGSCR